MICVHMSGAGNDFMVIDARDHRLDLPRLAKALCAQTGADGFMAVDRSQKADFRLHFYNSDGSRGEMCGNGSRCVSRFAYEAGIAGAEMTIETDAGLLHSHRLEERRYQVGLNLPSVLDLHRLEETAYVELGSPGVPHGVRRHPGLNWAERDALRAEMQALRRHRAFPKGANINYYDWIDPKTIRILTFERGVEDFTLACGTGSGAAAAVLWQQGLLPDGCLAVENPGGRLEFQLSGQDGRLCQISMAGSTDILTKYELVGNKLIPLSQCSIPQQPSPRFSTNV